MSACRSAHSTSIFWLTILLMAGMPAGARAQRVDSLAQARTLYVSALSGGPGAASLRDALVRRLSRSRFHLVQSAARADAVVKGTGQIWIRGYLSINPPSGPRQPVYGGYLSLEVSGADGQPLWSWLATPGHPMWNGIVDDLADQAARRLIEAGESRSGPAPAANLSSPLAGVTLSAGGSTFSAPLNQMWFESFEKIHLGVHLHYAAVGSQLGIENLLAGKLDFAGTDAPPAVIAGAAAARHLTLIASVLGGVVPIYNLRGVTRDLRFTPETLADIYLGKIRRWNDPEIQRTNEGAHLPDAEIAVVHRSDGSGTSWVWSNFLSQVSPAWAQSVGRGTIVQWPVGTGAEHNEGVADAVSKTPNSIGYVELTYAIRQQLSYGAVRNRSGEYVRASLESLAEAARSSDRNGAPQLAISNAPGKHAYPIAGFTWLAIPSGIADPAKRAVLLALFRWVLTSGQKECSALGYAPLPKELAESELRMLGKDSLP